MPIFAGLFVVVSALVFIGCGEQHNPKADPSPFQSSGLIVKGDRSSLIQAFETQGVRYKTLNAAHGIFQLQDLSEQQAKAAFPNSRIEKNYYLPNLLPVKAHHKVFDKLIHKNGILSRSDMENPANTEDEPTPKIFRGCEFMTSDRPIAAMTLDFPVTALTPQTRFSPARATGKLNDTAKFRGVVVDPKSLRPGQTPALDTESKMKYRWTVSAPVTSNFATPASASESKIFFGPTLQFPLDNVGHFKILVVAETESHGCGQSSFDLLVTHDPSIQLPDPDEKPVTADLDSFPHLKLVNAQEAWTLSQGEGTTVAILDSGVNFLNPGIRWNLAYDTTELQGTESEDRDQNGFAHDILGWDFANNDNNPFDDDGHGSHVAGLSASHVFGMAPKAKILPVKVLDASGGAHIGSVAAAIFYAVDKGADIVNLSLGTYGPRFYILKEAIAYANTKNVLVVAAAGNGDPKTGMGVNLNLPELDFINPSTVLCPEDGADVGLADLCQKGLQNANLVDFFPGELDNPNLLSVTAVDEHNELTKYANYGAPQIEVAAPGGTKTLPLISLATQNAAGFPLLPSVGTSMATPIVSGIAALLLSAAPELEPRQIMEIIMTTGTPAPHFKGKVLSMKTVNALDALKAVQNPQLQQLAVGGGVSTNVLPEHYQDFPSKDAPQFQEH